MHLLGILDFTGFVSTAGYAAIFILCVLQSCCVPTSSELTLGFAGALAAQGKLSLAAVIAVGTLGEVVGAYIAWVVGRYAGRAVVDRYGKYLLLSHRDLDRAEAWYDRHGRFGVFGSRLLPVIRNFVALPAGIAEVPLVRFGVLTAAGSLLWDGAWAAIGYGIGSHWHKIASAVGDLGYVLAVVAVGIICFAAYHRYRSYKEGTSTDGEGRHGSSPGTQDPTAGTVRWITSASGRPPAEFSALDADERTDRLITSSSSGRPLHARHPGAADAAGRRDFPDSPIAAWESAVLRGRREPEVSVRQQAEGQLPLAGRIFPPPLAAKVPEVIFAFWVVKILTTAGGEATSDFLRVYGNVKGGAVEVGLFVVGLVLQFATRRYRAFAYWFLAFAIAIFGTGVSDFLHLDVHIPYAGTTLLWAFVLAIVFLVWYRSEGTLSIHSITTQRREAFYWASVFATFALGTALGDFTATSLHLGYLASGVVFGVIIFLPALAWWKLGLNSVVAFWMSYVVTRPLGASFSDYLSKPHELSGINFGDGPTAVVFAVAVFVVVLYLAVIRPDIQHHVDVPIGRVRARPSPHIVSAADPELGLQ